MTDDVPFDDYVTYPDDKRPYSRDHKCVRCDKGFKTPNDRAEHLKATGHNANLSMSYCEKLWQNPDLKRFCDAALRIGIRQNCFPERDAPTGDEGVFYVSVNEKNVAFATFYETACSEPTLWLDLLWVDPEYRGQQVGEILLKQVKREALGRGKSRLGFGTIINNAAMRKLANKCGYQEAEVVFWENLDD